MRFKRLYILMTAGIGVLAGLAALQPKPNGSRPSARDDIAKSAYTKWRYIGQLRGKATKCPGVDGWDVQPLLQENRGSGYSRQRRPQPTPANQALIHKLGLDRFCAYTQKTGENRRFISPPELAVIKQDRMAMASFGTEVTVETGAQIESAVRSDMANYFSQPTGYSPLPLKGDPGVRLTFLDSQPTQGLVSSIPPPGAQHGYDLTQLARSLVCSTPDHSPDHCAATIASRRVLSYDYFEPSPPLPAEQGGHIGLISELGPEIVNAVDDWLQQPGHPSHLILNLSTGWDGDNSFDGLTPEKPLSELEPSVRSVYEALQYAAQNGVLVIAASGNRRGGSLNDSEWPTLPAAWELRHPSCTLFCPKLVYAVGGVDWQGLPLPNSRTKGLPQRVAFGDHAATKVKRPDLGQGQEALTGIYTGTSVSAAVVSSVAAVIWHLRPELEPAEVMELLDLSAKSREAQADFYPWRDFWPAPQLQEVSLCAAVQRACGAGGGDCSATLDVVPQCSDSTQPPILSLLLISDAPLPSYHTINPPPPLSPPCHPSTLLMTLNDLTPAPTDTCPTDKYSSVSAQRWNFPQPGDNPCPSCSIFPPPPRHEALVASLHPNVAALESDPSSEPSKKYYNLAIQIPSDWQTKNPGVILESATLDIDRFVDGMLKKRMTYPIFDTTKGETIPAIVTGLGDEKSLLGCRAQLNFVVVKDGTRMSIQNPVIVDP